jgi:hypothetical protein
VPDRLPPSLAWPVRPSEVRLALGENAESVDVAWASWYHKPSVTPLRATWEPRQPAAIGGWVGQGAVLWIEPVARTDVDRVRKLVRERLLGQACDWLATALTSGDGWQATRHEAKWSVSTSHP